MNAKTQYYMSKLDAITTGEIQLHGMNKKGVPWTGTMEIDKARRWVFDGGAIVTENNVLVMLYYEQTITKYILLRDNKQCQYCDEPGSIVDRVVPKSQGGLPSPKNCVCICEKCKLKKDKVGLESFLVLLAIEKALTDILKEKAVKRFKVA